MTSTATFTIEMHPGQSLIDGSARFDFTKTWNGALEGTSHGAMLTAGDPATGSAGYVALEIFDGTLEGRGGTIALQQLGTMDAGEPQLQFVLAPGSGTGELAGVTGTLTIESVGDDGVHQVGVALH
ncbi:MAG TPA: DUF3224 domain-containing protein [Candidatus Brachybacterium merdavium]|uniref:DUF3224 domain-containing protein n=1 Tax=Candidatus Brachybacterium merdavium TaxID=2838513 RepID=A0A9D2RPW3_9MICO|nr:DUF3224 domain-containing protein [Candidatus Brachybacterium merdavium]